MSSAKNQPTTIADQLAELDTLLAWFDNPDIDLDAALTKFEQGIKLTEAIKKRLVELENKVSILKERFDQESV